MSSSGKKGLPSVDFKYFVIFNCRFFSSVKSGKFDFSCLSGQPWPQVSCLKYLSLLWPECSGPNGSGFLCAVSGRRRVAEHCTLLSLGIRAPLCVSYKQAREGEICQSIVWENLSLTFRIRTPRVYFKTCRPAIISFSPFPHPISLNLLSGFYWEINCLGNECCGDKLQIWWVYFVSFCIMCRGDVLKVLITDNSKVFVGSLSLTSMRRTRRHMMEALTSSLRNIIIKMAEAKSQQFNFIWSYTFMLFFLVIWQCLPEVDDGIMIMISL